MKCGAGLIAILAVSLLVGCGGGGDTTVATGTTFPVESAVTTFVQSPHSFTANFTDMNGDIFTLAFGFVPGGDTNFEGQAAKTSSRTLNLKKNGVLISTNTSTEFFQIGPFKPLGNVLGTGEFTVNANLVALPASGKVGDLGNFFTATEFSNSSKTNIVFTDVVTWSIEQTDTADTAFFCTNHNIKFTNGISATESDCFKINANGAVIGNRISLFVNGKAITFIN